MKIGTVDLKRWDKCSWCMDVPHDRLVCDYCHGDGYVRSLYEIRLARGPIERPQILQHTKWPSWYYSHVLECWLVLACVAVFIWKHA